jgi:hypothetical protein
VGIDSSTTVNPFRPAGQAVKPPDEGGRGVVVAGGGVVGTVGAVVVGVPCGTVGRVAVAVAGGVLGTCAEPLVVATSVLPPLSSDPPMRIAAVAPATAITRPSRTGHIQSPG